MNNPKLKETLGRFFVTEKFKKLAEEKGLTGKPVAKFNRESACDVGEGWGRYF